MKGLVYAIFATDENMGFGLNNSLPWNNKDDLKHFRAVTSGHVLIMGRRTWESVPQHKVTQNRTCIVITSGVEKLSHGAIKAISLEDAIDAVQGRICFLIGGKRVIEDALDKQLVDCVLWSKIKGVFESDVKLKKENDLLKHLSLQTTTFYDNFTIFTFVRGD